MTKIEWNAGAQPRSHVAWFVESNGGFAMYAVAIRPCAGTGYSATIVCFDEDFPQGSEMSAGYPGYHEGHGASLDACKAFARRWARDNYMVPVSSAGAPAAV